MKSLIGTIVYSIIYLQEVVLHSLGLPHVEAAAMDPLIIKHTCDSCCEWVVAKVTFN